MTAYQHISWLLKSAFMLVCLLLCYHAAFAQETPAPAPINIEGQIYLQASATDVSQIHIDILQNNSPVTTAAVDTAGQYVINMPAPENDTALFLRIDAPLHLPTLVPLTTIMPDIILSGGDLNDDGCINDTDLAQMAATFEQASPYDLTGDGLILVDDLTILAGNFNGDCVPPAPQFSEATAIPESTPAVEITLEVTAIVEITPEITPVVEITTEAVPEVTETLSPVIETTPEVTPVVEVTADIVPEVTAEPIIVTETPLPVPSSTPVPETTAQPESTPKVNIPTTIPASSTSVATATPVIATETPTPTPSLIVPTATVTITASPVPTATPTPIPASPIPPSPTPTSLPVITVTVTSN